MNGSPPARSSSDEFAPTILRTAPDSSSQVRFTPDSSGSEKVQFFFGSWNGDLAHTATNGLPGQGDYPPLIPFYPSHTVPTRINIGRNACFTRPTTRPTPVPAGRSRSWSVRAWSVKCVLLRQAAWRTGQEKELGPPPGGRSSPLGGGLAKNAPGSFALLFIDGE
jgi:hypothetical protein